MYNRYKIDFLSGGGLFVCSLIVLFFLIPNYVSMGGSAEISPRFFPKIAAVALAVLSFSLIVKSFLALYRHEKWAGPADLFIPRMDTAPSVRPFLCVAIVALYFILFEHVGFLLATPPVVALLMLSFGQRRPVRIAAISLVLTGVVFVLFTYGLKVPLQ